MSKYTTREFYAGCGHDVVKGFISCPHCRIEELEAENRIFRSTESVDDSVWDALLEQIRQHHDRIEELEAHGLCRCADEVRCDMRKLITACEPYLKDGETPAECIQRNRDDTGAVLKLLAKEKRKHTALLERLKEAYEEGRELEEVQEIVREQEALMSDAVKDARKHAEKDLSGMDRATAEYQLLKLRERIAGLEELCEIYVPEKVLRLMKEKPND